MNTRKRLVLSAILLLPALLIALAVPTQVQSDIDFRATPSSTSRHAHVLLTVTGLSEELHRTETAIYAPFTGTYNPMELTATHIIALATQAARTPQAQRSASPTSASCQPGLATWYRRDLNEQITADLRDSGLELAAVNVNTTVVINVDGQCGQNVSAMSTIFIRLFVPELTNADYLRQLTESLNHQLAIYNYADNYGRLEFRVQYVDAAALTSCTLPPVAVDSADIAHAGLKLDSAACAN